MLIKLAVIFILLILATIITTTSNLVAYFLTKKDREALAATKQWGDASGRLLKWIEKHPFYSESDAEFQALLRTEIGAYMMWLDTHPFCNNEHNRNHLSSLMERVNDDW